jgi:hypothetical protein
MSDALIAEAALAAAAAWGAGLRLYAVALVLGLLGRYAGFDLPDTLQWLSHPLALGIAGLLTLAEFVGDKIPLIDSASDTVQTFVRIPAGAALAAAFFGDSGGAAQTLAALLGGGIAASSHIAKAGSRAFINTSPEPVSNVALSLGEDGMVAAMVALALAYPVVAGVVAVMFALASAVVAVVLFKAVRALSRRWRSRAATGGLG